MVRPITELARKLRIRQTASEKRFWSLVRNKGILGLKFYRQFPFVVSGGRMRRQFISDFYCPELKLIVEIDGGIHQQQKEYDEYRTEVLNSLGVRVIRFSNEEVNNNLIVVLQKLKQHFPSLGERGVRGES